jgi:hypothetical protein
MLHVCPKCTNRPKVFTNESPGLVSFTLSCVWCKEAGPDPAISFNPRVASQQWNEACVRFAQSMVTRAKAQAQRREESAGTVPSSQGSWL